MSALLKLFSADESPPIKSLVRSGNKKPFYKVDKPNSYDVVVDITGDAPYSSCVLSVNATTGGDRKLPIAARFSWKRYYRGPEEEISASGNSLHLSPLDAGMFIKVYINPIEEDNIYGDVSTVIFGPIMLDPMVKRTLQGIMRAGGFKFQLQRVMLGENDEVGSDGMIMLSHNCIHVITKKYPKSPLKLMLFDRFKIVTQRNQFKNFTIEFYDDSHSSEIANMFGIPKSHKFKKLRFVLSSLNTRDLLVMSISIFKSLSRTKDTEIFEKVMNYFKEAQKGGLKRVSHPDDAEEEPSPFSPPPNSNIPEQEDAIDALFFNNGLRDEVFKLYSSNKEMAVEKKNLQMKVFNLESELSRSINQKTINASQDMHDSKHDLEQSIMDSNKMQYIRQKNSEIASNIQKIESENRKMKDEVERITKIFKQMRYKELMESKLNATTMSKNPQKDISNLERALDDYAKEYEKVMASLKGGAGMTVLPELEADRSLSLVDEMEERALEMLMKNERLQDEIQKYQILIEEIEKKQQSSPVGGGTSFIGNASFLGGRGMRPEAKLEYDMKIQGLDKNIKKITQENKDLTDQISSIRKSLAEQEEYDQEAIVYRKLKSQKVDLQRMLESKKRKNIDLAKMKIALSDQEIDLKAATQHVSDLSSKRIDDARERKSILEKTNALLQKEIDQLVKMQESLEEEQMKAMRQSTYSLTANSNIERLQATVRELQQAIEKQSAKMSMTSPQTPMTPTLSKEDMANYLACKNMNEKLIHEIVRLNEIVKKLQS